MEVEGMWDVSNVEAPAAIGSPGGTGRAVCLPGGCQPGTVGRGAARAPAQKTFRVKTRNRFAELEEPEDDDNEVHEIGEVRTGDGEAWHGRDP